MPSDRELQAKIASSHFKCKFCSYSPQYDNHMPESDPGKELIPCTIDGAPGLLCLGCYEKWREVAFDTHLTALERDQL